MKNWINKNYKTLIITAFLIPILTVAVVSISHVTEWYGISNPVTWAVYLSIGIEIAALSALAAISANMGSKVYFPFAIVTIVQFIGNIFFAYSYINIDSKQFKDWVDLVAPLVEYMGVNPNDYIGHKRFLALFSGGMLPLISLSFLHMLVKFTEEDRLNQKPVEEEPVKVNSSEIVSEVSRLRLSEEDMLVLEKILNNPPPPNENLKRAAKEYLEKKQEVVNETPLVSDDFTIGPNGAFEMQEEPVVEDKEQLNVPPQNTKEMMLTTNNDIISSIPADDEISDWDLDMDEKPEEVLGQQETSLPENNFQTMMDEIIERKKTRGELLSEIMQGDQELGLYDEPFENIEPKDLDIIVDPIDQEIEATETIEDTYNISQSIEEKEIVPALSDEEVNQMLLDEWEKKYEFGDHEDDEIFQEEPTNDDEMENFSIINPETENIFQENVQKFNIDEAYETKEDNDFANDEPNTFWRDHLNDIEEDLKKK
jgi:hypothetical protein